MTSTYPTASLGGLYDAPVAPVIEKQLRSSAGSQAIHWYSKLATVPTQIPADAVSVPPTVGEPETTGGSTTHGSVPVYWPQASEMSPSPSS